MLNFASVHEHAHLYLFASIVLYVGVRHVGCCVTA